MFQTPYPAIRRYTYPCTFPDCTREREISHAVSDDTAARILCIGHKFEAMKERARKYREKKRAERSKDLGTI